MTSQRVFDVFYLFPFVDSLLLCEIVFAEVSFDKSTFILGQKRCALGSRRSVFSPLVEGEAEFVRLLRVHLTWAPYPGALNCCRAVGVKIRSTPISMPYFEPQGVSEQRNCYALGNGLKSNFGGSRIPSFTTTVTKSTYQSGEMPLSSITKPQIDQSSKTRSFTKFAKKWVPNILHFDIEFV